MKTFFRAATALLIGIVSFGAASAQAADSWLPRFDRDQHVYIAPNVTSSVRSDFAIGDFKTEVAEAAKKQNLDVYVIVTRTADDGGASVGGSGPVLVRKVWQNWTGNSSFPSRRALVILMTGGNSGKLVSVGVRAGEALNDMGINRDVMNDPDGPVMPVLRNSLNNAPTTVPTQIVNNISAIVAAKSGSAVGVVDTSTSTTASNPAAPATTSESSSMSPFVFVIGGLVVGLIVILVLRARRSSASSTSGNVFEDRLRSSSRSGSSESYPPAPGSVPSNNSSSTARDATILGAGALGGYVLGSEVQRRRDEDRRRDDSTTTTTTTTSGSDTYVAPASSCSTPSSPASSCSSGSSSCGGGGSSCGGGGSSCGGGS